MAKNKREPEIKIDPEFEALIPPLSDDEYKQLKENIYEAGEVREPIIIWHDMAQSDNAYVIIDGHHRWKALQELQKEHPDEYISWYWSAESFLYTRQDVKEWMIKNQLGRRNLTREQKLRYIGQLQASRKNTRGGDRGNQYTKEAKGQNEPLAKTTAQQIAEEVGVSESTVKRAEKFSQGIDALETVSKEAVKKVLNGKSGVSVSDVSNFPKMNPDEQEDFIDIVVNPEKKKKKEKETGTLCNGNSADQLSDKQLLEFAKKFMKTFFEPKDNGMIPFDKMMQMFDACADDYWQLAEVFKGEDLGELYKIRAIGLAQYAILLNLFNYNDIILDYKDRRWKFGYDEEHNLHIIPPKEYESREN